MNSNVDDVAHARPAFSLVELLVSVAVLGILVLLVGQLFNGATLATTSASKHIDCDTQARAVFERMNMDFAQMLRRPDVDYFLKDNANTQIGTNGEGGNDQIAFFSQVPGSVSDPKKLGLRSPLSLVAYRTESTPCRLQRMGCGLLWDAIPPEGMMFSPLSRSSGATVISQYWPAATDLTPDVNYELVGSDIFRMEYCYVLKTPVSERGTPIMDANGDKLEAKLSAVPWDTRIPGHTSVSGLRDVSGLIVMLAIIDPKSRVTAQEADLSALASAMPDFQEGMEAGDLEATWRSASEAQHLRTVHHAGIRFYSRCFYLQ